MFIVQLFRFQEYCTLWINIDAGNIRTSNEMRHLEAYIVDAFSSPACLNASFLKGTNDSEDQHAWHMRNVVSAVSATNAESGIDLLMVRKTYDLLLHNNKLTVEIKKVIKTCFDIRYASFEMETIRECFFNEKENLRVFLICFENLILLEPNACHVALERIIRGWMSLSKAAREVLFSDYLFSIRVPCSNCTCPYKTFCQ